MRMPSGIEKTKKLRWTLTSLLRVINLVKFRVNKTNSGTSICYASWFIVAQLIIEKMKVSRRTVSVCLFFKKKTAETGCAPLHGLFLLSGTPCSFLRRSLIKSLIEMSDHGCESSPCRQSQSRRNARSWWGRQRTPQKWFDRGNQTTLHRPDIALVPLKHRKWNIVLIRIIPVSAARISTPYNKFHRRKAAIGKRMTPNDHPYSNQYRERRYTLTSFLIEAW